MRFHNKKALKDRHMVKLILLALLRTRDINTRYIPTRRLR